MKSNFYKISQENFQTILKYYESVNTRVKKYYKNVLKYKTITSEYCTKIKELFGQEKDCFVEQDYMESFDSIEIDFGLNNKEMKNKFSLPNEIYEKKIDISPIKHIASKINKFFNNYIT